jgi:Tol biopolymer transport system component
LLVRAKEWHTNQRNASFLLQGDDLSQAETWLGQAMGKKPEPTDLHTAYIFASRKAATARQRRLLAGVTVALVVSVLLTILSLGLFGEANRQQGIAQNEANNRATQEAIAVTARREAEINAAAANAGATQVADANQLAQSVALAGQAEIELDGPRPDRGVLLALAAFQGNRYTWQAERALAVGIQGQLAQADLPPDNGQLVSLDWSPDGKLLLAGTSQGSGLVWDTVGTPLFGLLSQESAAPVTNARWSLDGLWIALSYADGHVAIWAVSGKESAASAVWAFGLAETPGGTAHQGSVVDMAWSSDNTHLMTVGEDRTVKVWDGTTGSLTSTLRSSTATFIRAVWSPDGKRLLTVSADRTARIWDANSQREVLTPINPVVLVSWSPNGTQLATTSTNNTINLWNVSQREATLVFRMNGHTGRINQLAWSKDGKWLASASSDDSARIWNPVEGTLLRTLFGHTRDVNDLVWATSAGNPRLITVGNDATMRLWNGDTGGQLMQIDGENGAISRVLWAGDGENVATLSEDGSAQLWQVWKSGRALMTFARRCCVERILTDEENLQFGLPTATIAPTPEVQPTALPGCETLLAVRLYPGARGKVSEDDPELVNVREGPGTSFNRIAQVSPGQTFQVLDGPQCAEGFNWYHIIYGVGAVQGWIAEGKDEQYFIEPVE